jgi:transposase
MELHALQKYAGLRLAQKLHTEQPRYACSGNLAQCARIGRAHRPNRPAIGCSVRTGSLLTREITPDFGSLSRAICAQLLTS